MPHSSRTSSLPRRKGAASAVHVAALVAIACAAVLAYNWLYPLGIAIEGVFWAIVITDKRRSERQKRKASKGRPLPGRPGGDGQTWIA
jgi:hypothetical protein